MNKNHSDQLHIFFFKTNISGENANCIWDKNKEAINLIKSDKYLYYKILVITKKQTATKNSEACRLFFSLIILIKRLCCDRLVKSLLGTKFPPTRSNREVWMLIA